MCSCQQKDRGGTATASCGAGCKVSSAGLGAGRSCCCAGKGEQAHTPLRAHMQGSLLEAPRKDNRPQDFPHVPTVKKTTPRSPILSKPSCCHTEPLKNSTMIFRGLAETEIKDFPSQTGERISLIPSEVAQRSCNKVSQEKRAPHGCHIFVGLCIKDKSAPEGSPDPCTPWPIFQHVPEEAPDHPTQTCSPPARTLQAPQLRHNCQNRLK